MEKNSILTEETPQMEEAFKKAQENFKYFWRELSWEYRRIVPALGFCCVKVAFHQEGVVPEFMWLTHIDFDGFTVKGELINDPNELTNIKAGDVVEIPLEEICDWMFTSNNEVMGGFTVQVMRSEMDKKARKAHDKAWGLKFTDEVLLVSGQKKHPENLIEHPMSINMKDKMKEMLTQYPEELTRTDEVGYTLLHKEVIAGNKTCVEALLAMGADVNAKTNNGYTALDFAEKFKWTHILSLLEA